MTREEIKMTLIQDTLKQRILADEYSYEALKKIACRLYEENESLKEELESETERAETISKEGRNKMEMQVREKCEFCENGLIQNPQWQEFYKTYGEEELRKMSHEKYEECLREFFCINKYVAMNEVNLPSEEMPCDKCEGETWIYSWVDVAQVNAVAVKRLTATVEITDFDIATIEALHDLLLDKHNYELNHTTLANARKLTHKMYEAFKST